MPQILEKLSTEIKKKLHGDAGGLINFFPNLGHFKNH